MQVREAWGAESPTRRRSNRLPPLSASHRQALSRSTSVYSRLDGTAPASLLASEAGFRKLGTNDDGEKRPWSSGTNSELRTLPRALRAQEESKSAKETAAEAVVRAHRGVRSRAKLETVPDTVLWPTSVNLHEWAMLTTDATLERLAAVQYRRAAEAERRLLAKRKPNRSLTLQAGSYQRRGHTSLPLDLSLSDPLEQETKVDPLDDDEFADTVLRSLVVTDAVRVGDIGVKSVGEASFGALASVELRGLPNLTDAGVRALALACPNLVRVNLSGCVGVEGAGVAALAESCRGLEEVRLSGVPTSSWSLARLGRRLEKLKVLDVSGNVHVGDAEVGMLVGGGQLRELYLRDCTHVTDVGVSAACRGRFVRELQTLDLSRTPGGAAALEVTDVALEALSRGCPALQCLHLDQLEAITDVGLSWLAEGCQNLREIHLTGCSKVSDAGLGAILEATGGLRLARLALCKRIGDRGIGQLGLGAKLQHLDLSSLILVTDGRGGPTGIRGLVETIPGAMSGLQELRLSGCVQIGDAALGRLCGAVTGLRVLEAAGLPRLTAMGLVSAMESLRGKGLETLDLSGNGAALRDAVLHAVGVSCGSSLSSLNVSRSERLTDRGVAELVKRCSGLERLILDKCVRLTDLTCFTLAEKDFRPGLLELRLDGVEAVSDTGLGWLALRCQRLLKLQVRGCSVSRSGLKSIVAAFDHVRVREDRMWKGLWPEPFAERYRRLDDFAAEWNAALMMQSVFRVGQARKRAERRRRNLRVARARVRLQSFARQLAARREVARRREAALRMFNARLVVQSFARQLAARREVARLRERRREQMRFVAAVHFQRLWRGKLGRRRAVEVRERRAAARKRFRGAVLLAQTLWRGLQARRRARRLREARRRRLRAEDDAARAMQRVFRGHLGRVAAAERRRELEEEERKRRKAVVWIQARVRGLLARRAKWRLEQWRLLRDEAARWIQARWRARKGRLAAHLVRAGRYRERAEQAALLVQRAWRRKQSRFAHDVLRRARIARAEAIEDAARRMQRIWRGHTGRSRAMQLRQLKLADLERNVRFLKQAAIAIQRRWRGILGRRRAEAMRRDQARRWKAMEDEEGRTFFYDKVTAEIRYRRPQQILDSLPQPPCDNCQANPAVQECADCKELFCQTCFAAVHAGGRRRNHSHRPLYDYYGHRIDYGEGDWPSVWPTEIEQDDILGWSLKPSKGVEENKEKDEEKESEEVETKRYVPKTIEVGGTVDKAEREGDNDGWEKRVGVYDGGRKREVVFLDTKRGVVTAERPIFFVSPRDEPPEEDLPELASYWIRKSNGKWAKEKKREPRQQEIWEEYVDDSTGLPYYHSRLTGETIWERPNRGRVIRMELEEDEDDEEDSVFAGSETQVPITVSGGEEWVAAVDESTGAPYEYNPATGETRWMDASVLEMEGDTEPPENFAKYFDDTSQAEYWMSAVTGTSTWERPKGWSTPRGGVADETEGWFIAPVQLA